MDNKEMILDELTNFEKRKPKEIPHILEEYLIRIAKTGDTMFPWIKLKPLFMCKMERVISEFNETSPADDLAPCPNVERFKYELMKEKLLEAIDNFSSSAPFTIQRLCELITTPRKHYKHTDKFMRGLEKNVLVVSTVEPGCSHIFACDCARKRADHQNSAMMNGIIDTPNVLNGVDMYSVMYSEEEREQPLPTAEDELNSSEVENHDCPPTSSPLPVSIDENAEDERKKNSTADEKFKSLTSDDYQTEEPVIENPVPPAPISSSPPPNLDASTDFIPNSSGESPKTDEKSNNQGTYNSDDTVSSSTQCPVESKRESDASNVNLAHPESEEESTNEKLKLDPLSGNNSVTGNKTETLTEKSDDQIGSSSQDIDFENYAKDPTAGPNPSAKEEVLEDGPDESVETSSVEDGGSGPDSVEASSSQYSRSPVFEDETECETMEKSVEEEQPSSSDLSTDDSTRKLTPDTGTETNGESPVTTMNDSTEEVLCSNSEEMAVSSVVISESLATSPCSPFSSQMEPHPESSLSSSSSSSLSSVPSQTPPPFIDDTSVSNDPTVSSEETAIENVSFSNVSESEEAEMLPAEDIPEPMEQD